MVVYAYLLDSLNEIRFLIESASHLQIIQKIQNYPRIIQNYPELSEILSSCIFVCYVCIKLVKFSYIIITLNTDLREPWPFIIKM